MTRRTSSRIAGITFLVYIAAGLTGMWLWGRIPSDSTMAAKLAGIAQHSFEIEGVILLDLVCALSAVTLGVALYALTRNEDRELAMMGLACRLVEGVLAAIGVADSLALKWLAATTAPDLAHTASVHTLVAYLSLDTVALTSTFFALGSLFYSILFLRGRLIPGWMAWLGVASSILLVLALPLQLVGLLHGVVASIVWVPMLLFEVPLGVWLIVKGVASHSRRQEETMR